ncbi:uncharacterized protein LOC129722726 [Wyeomyia smithii]|uniref:uncharacterized protein LOC129722726 n=1 Tax=Wyeomyia smithii TaxID=174621 RepID=UPI002467F618|nr:uncharacterized protein LOC129722726 [Wyeomyia smithii]
MAFSDVTRRIKDLILNNKAATFLSVALFAFIISTLALASSNQSKKDAIGQCEASYNEKMKGPSCSVPIKTGLPEKEPVYLLKKADSLYLWLPHESSLEWNSTVKQSTLLCSGTGNMLVKTNQISSETTCVEGTTFSLSESVKATAKELECKENVSPDAIDAGSSCGFGMGQMYHIGFKASDTEFVTYIQSCFDTKRASVLYTMHYLPGAAIASAATTEDSDWIVTGMPDILKPDNSYKQAQQKEQFTKLLGSADQANKYINDTQLLIAGHMTPKGDGVFRSWKRATFFYINAVPQWKTIKTGNLNRVEATVLEIAQRLHESLLVIQGTSGVLTLPHVNGTEVSIALEETAIDVPLWTWKIVKSPSRDAGIAFVTLNNPFETKTTSLKPPCDDICSDTGFSVTQYKTFTDGYTICCDPNWLVRNVRFAPEEGMAHTVLTRDMLPSSGSQTIASLILILLILVITKVSS